MMELLGMTAPLEIVALLPTQTRSPITIGFVIYLRKIYSIEFLFVMIIITFVGSIIGQLGDLLASGIKRDHKIKDYGNVIPGHGGIMDRFDSVIFVIPCVYFLAAVLVPLIE